MISGVNAAVSCRRLLQVTHLLRLEVPLLQAHKRACCRFDEYSCFSASFVEGTTICICHRGEDLLRAFPPLCPSTQRASRAYNLCVDCLRHLLTKGAYWDRRRRGAEMRVQAYREELAPGLADPDDEGLLDFDWQEAWLESQRLFGSRLKVQCPPCAAGEFVAGIHESGGLDAARMAKVAKMIAGASEDRA